MPSLPPPTPALVSEMIPSASDGWSFYDSAALQTIRDTRGLVADAQDYNFPTVFGWSFGNDVSFAGFVERVRQVAQDNGAVLYYVGAWRNPPGGPFGTGIDTYRIVTVMGPS